MTRRIGVGVVGCGEIAHVHLPAIVESHRAELIAVCDLSPAVATFTAEKYGAMRAYSDFGALLADESVECVHILTPPETHESLIRATLEQKRHVICEKPITLDISQFKELLALAGRQGCYMMECQHYIFNDVVRRLHHLCGAGEIGELREICCELSLDLSDSKICAIAVGEAADALPLGIVHDFLPHLCYLTLSFCASQLETEWLELRRGRSNGRIQPSEVGVTAFLRSEDVRAVIRFNSDTCPDSFRVVLKGSKGELSAELFNPCIVKIGQPHVGAKTAIGRVRSGAALIAGAARLVIGKINGVDPYQGIAPMLDGAYREIATGVRYPSGIPLMIRSMELIENFRSKLSPTAGDSASSIAVIERA